MTARKVFRIAIHLVNPLLMAASLGGSVALAQEPAVNPQPVPSFPRVRWSPDPFYTSEGFRLGHIIKMTYGGLFIFAYEGQMTLGTGATMQTFFDRDCYALKVSNLSKDLDPGEHARALARIEKECTVTENPWPFSFFDKDLYQDYLHSNYDLVVVYYIRPLFSLWRIFTKSMNYVKRIWKTNANYKVAKEYKLDKNAFLTGEELYAKESYVEGRIVKASMDHLLRKTYEVIIQEGNYSPSYVAMTINDPDMFDHVVKCMLSGKLLRIGYVKLFAFQGFIASAVRDYDTYYRITSIETITHPQTPAPIPKNK